MCDTFAPLYPTKAALDLDDLAYPRSWESGWEPAEAAANGHTNGHANGHANGKTASKSKAGAKGKKVKSAPTPATASSARRSKAANTWD